MQSQWMQFFCWMDDGTKGLLFLDEVGLRFEMGWLMLLCALAKCGGIFAM